MGGADDPGQVPDRAEGFQPDVYDLLEADHGGGFVEVGPQDYAAAVDMIGRLGLTDPEK